VNPATVVQDFSPAGTSHLKVRITFDGDLADLKVCTTCYCKKNLTTDTFIGKWLSCCTLYYILPGIFRKGTQTVPELGLTPEEKLSEYFYPKDL
jgi:hypothetical protein